MVGKRAKQLEPEVDVTFRAEGPGPSLAIRVRHMLKLALRACGLRCVSVNKLKAHEPPATKE